MATAIWPEAEHTACQAAINRPMRTVFWYNESMMCFFARLCVPSRIAAMCARQRCDWAILDRCRQGWQAGGARRLLAPIVPYVAALVLWFLPVACSQAEVFDWRNVDGRDFTTPTRKQIDQACWAYAAIGALEAKYKITRNDPTFSLDLSELQLIEGGHGGSRTGGWPNEALDWIAANGVVREEDYPLRPDWRAKMVRMTGHRNDIFLPVAQIKQLLKEHGPLTTIISADNNWWPDPGPRRALHAVVVVGYCDDSAVPGGGYWIVKNSWREGDDWRQVPFSVNTVFSAITGSVYYTAPLRTVVWDVSGEPGFQQGAGVWSTAAACWSADGLVPQAWRNGEDAAVFKASGAWHTVTLDDGLSVHGMTFEAGALYTLEGGSLIITAGGITAHENVTIRTPLLVGAPQQWQVAAEKMLELHGPLNTHINLLTVGGEGDTRLLGPLEGKGPLIKTGPGRLTVAAGGSHHGIITIQQGTLAIEGTLSAEHVAISSGASLRGGGTLATAQAVVATGAIVEPGGSVGVLTISGDLRLEGTLRWQLADLGDNSTPQAAGTLFDQLQLLGGRLSLGRFCMELEFSADAVPQQHPFWYEPHRWTVITGFGDLQGWGEYTVTGYSGPLGAFSVEGPDGSTQAIRLVWTPVPEPAALVLLAAALAAMMLARRRWPEIATRHGLIRPAA